MANISIHLHDEKVEVKEREYALGSKTRRYYVVEFENSSRASLTTLFLEEPIFLTLLKASLDMRTGEEVE